MAVNRLHFSFWLHSGVRSGAFIENLVKLGGVRRTSNPEKIMALAERGNGLPNLEAKLMLDYAITAGKGGMYLKLSDQPYTALSGAQG